MRRVEHVIRKDHVRTVRGMIGERRLVESASLHHAVVRQMFDDQVHEADLIDGERRVGKEPRESLGRRLAVEPDQRADEETQSVSVLRGAGDVRLLTRTAFQEHALQRSEVSSVQLFVAAQPLQRHMAFVVSKVGARLC